MKVTRIAVYCRVSSDRQREEKNIQNQIQMAKETLRTLAALAKEGEIFKVVPQCPDTHSDENPSFFLDDGFNLETLEQESAFMDLVSRIRAFEVDVIWVYDVNRVFRARSNSVLGTIMDIIENHDVRIMSPLYGMLEAGPVLQILGMMGSLDKKQTLAKLHDGKFARAVREGRPSNGQPGFGFLWNKRQIKWELEPGELRIMRWCGALGVGWLEKDFPETLQKVHEKYPDGAPDMEVIDALNQAGFNLKNFFERNNYQKRLLKNPTGRFGMCFLASLFRHDRYRGQYELRFKETRLVGKPGAKNLPRETKRQVLVSVPRIFSEEEWAKLKSKRMERSTWSKKFVKCEYLLKDLVICGTCGLKLGARAKSKHYVRKSTGESARTFPTTYYACIRKPSVKRKCPARSYYAGKPLDNFVWQKVRKVLAGTDSKPASSADQSLKISFMAMQESLDQCQVQITGLESQRESVVTLRVRGQISDIDFTKELQRIETEKRVIIKRQQKVKQELEAYQKASNEGVDLDAVREKYGKRVDKLTFDERQVAIRAMVQNVVVQSEKEAEIIFKKILSNVSIPNHFVNASSLNTS